MRAAAIHVGDRLQLKAGQRAYGLGPIVISVSEIVPRAGYAVPWIRGHYRHVNGVSGLECLDFGSFKPSDFKRSVT